jgi:hypothetical protein
MNALGRENPLYITHIDHRGLELLAPAENEQGSAVTWRATQISRKPAVSDTVRRHREDAGIFEGRK